MTLARKADPIAVKPHGVARHIANHARQIARIRKPIEQGEPLCSNME